ncbi:hypothetical protein R83H12_00333 [Fibrobacteria bacterium R8-3-H12]
MANKPKKEPNKFEYYRIGRFMKLIPIALIFTSSVCFAQNPFAVDSLVKAVSCLEVEKQTEIKKSIDSITIKATEKSLELYEKSFDKMQNSFSYFLTAVSIIIGALGLFAFFRIKDSEKTKKYIEAMKKEAKETAEKIENTNEEIENMKKETQKTTEDINDLKKKLKEQTEDQKIEIDDKLTEVDESLKRTGELFVMRYSNELNNESSDLIDRVDSAIMLLGVIRTFDLYLDGDINDILAKIRDLIAKLKPDSTSLTETRRESILKSIFDIQEFCSKNNSRESQKTIIKEIVSELEKIFKQNFTAAKTEWEKEKSSNITEVTINTLDRFKSIAKKINSNLEIKFGELKPGGYVHVLRNSRIIGCFKRYEGIPVFEYHNSHPYGRKIKSLNDLTDKDIEDAINNTPGNPRV